MNKKQKSKIEKMNSKKKKRKQKIIIKEYS